MKNNLFFEFSPKADDKLINLVSIRKYDHIIAFVSPKDKMAFKSFVTKLDTPISEITLNDPLAGIIIEENLIKLFIQDTNSMSFIAISKKCSDLEKISLKLISQNKIKACFVCLEDSDSAIFDTSEIEFVRLCIDMLDSENHHEGHVSSSEKFDIRFVGKFAFLKKLITQRP